MGEPTTLSGGEPDARQGGAYAAAQNARIYAAAYPAAQGVMPTRRMSPPCRSTVISAASSVEWGTEPT